MVPSFRCMDSYTQPHPYQIPYYPNNYHPSWEVIPPTKHDSIRPPPSYGPRWYGGMSGYPYQTEFHGCCNHGYPHPPEYHAFGPSHAYVPPPGAFCYHGPYLPYAGAFPPYHAPPHYTTEQPRYEFDKDMHRGHCCGCSNHVCKQKEDKGVKIEEHEPDIGKKGSDSSTPVKFENSFPYPFLWVPPEYLKNTDCKKSSDFGPKMWNGWYPFANRIDNENKSGKTSESLRQGEDVKDNRIQSCDDNRGQFQFPLLWVPNFNKQDEPRNRDSKESDTSSETMEEKPSKLKIIPVNLPGNDGSGVKPEVMCDTDNCDPPLKKTEKATQSRNIPVMQIKEGGTEKSAETERKSEKTDEKQMEQKDKSFSNNSLKNQSSSLSSPKKGSKLPPVCLRVDPLPRRKSGSGTSRSPSPPGVKKASENSEVTESASAPLLVNKSSLVPSEQASFQNKNEVKPVIKDVEVREAKELDEHNKDEVRRDSNQFQSKNGVPDDRDSPITGDSGLLRKEHTSNFKETKTTEGGEMCEKEQTSESKESIDTVKETMVEERRAKKELSTTEAACLIQSFYRGFEVRKLEPLKKLRQIAEVRKQADEISERIQTLVSSPDLQKDGKQRMLIGETIMTLLLQLDTIQGLHPSVRDIRKAVARKLVCLQERLDSLISQMPEEISSETTSLKKTSLQEAPKITPDSGCAPPEPLERPEQAECPRKAEVSKDDASPSLIIKDEEPSLEPMGDDLGKPTEAHVEGTPFEMPEQAECPHKAEEQLPEQPEDVSKDDASPSLIIKDEEPSLVATGDDLGKPTEAHVEGTPIEMPEQAECPHKAEEQLPEQPEDVSKDDAPPSLIIKAEEPSEEATGDDLGKPTEAPVEGTPFEMLEQAECPHKAEEQLPEQPEDVSKDDISPSLIMKEGEPSLKATEDDLGKPTGAHVEGSLAMDVSESDVERLPDLSVGIQDVVDEKADSKVEPSGILKEGSAVSFKKDKPCELQVELKPLDVEGMVPSAFNGVSSPLAEHLPGLANGVQDEVDEKADSGVDLSELVKEDRHCLLQGTESLDMIPDLDAGDMLEKLSQEVEVGFPCAETNQLLYPPGTDEGQVPLPEVKNPEPQEVVDEQREKDSGRDADYIKNDVLASQIMEQEHNVVAGHVSKDGLASTAMMEEHNEDVEVCHTNQLSICPPAESKLEEQCRGDDEHPASPTDLAPMSPDNMDATEIEVPGVTRGVRDSHNVMASLIMEGENNKCVVDCHQEQQYVHPSAKENKQEEGLIGEEVNKVHIGSEPPTLTGLPLTSEKDTIKEMEVLGTDCKSSSSLEEAEVPDVIELLYEDSCVDPVSSESNPSGDDCPKSEAKVVKYLEQLEEPGYEEVVPSNPDRGSAEEKKLLEENEKLREMVSKLLQEGKQQLAVISDLSGRVRGLERKLTTKKKQRIRRHRAAPAACVIKPRNVRCFM